MASDPRVTVASAQLRGAGGRLEDRLARLDALAAEAAAGGARLLVTPEMSAHGYDLGPGAPAEAIGGPACDALVEMARAHDLFVVAGLTERAGRDRYNVLALAGPDGLVGRYRKLHVSSVETARWRDGDGPAVLECDLGRVGLGICADMLFPTPWRGYVGRVDVVAIGAAWPDHAHTRPFPYGAAFARTHAAATADVPLHLSAALGVPVVLANAAGTFEARVPPLGTRLQGRFAGRSCIADGALRARADDDSEALLVAEVRWGPRAPSAPLEPWIPSWSRRFRLAAQLGDVASGRLCRVFYRRDGR